ncbi:AAA ATPase Elf1 [Saxophila tyrrhenica]|uniref:Transcription elongation factor 1 homolog n=1 Tax=Saxophila tyrrhenica TaxID=1690608 RepID=A0AAV9P7I5_9PEZI|nr:AAA ATPase Elf1 [Saxophila tyrrhenica]
MGKRKKSSRGPTGPKKREPLATSFRCVFCNHETSVSVKIDKKAGVGNLSCKSCGQAFQTGINYLTQPVDVYSDWIDACDAVAKDQTPAARPAMPPAARQRVANTSARAGLAPGEKYTEEDEGFIVDDERDDEAEFADE